MSIEVQLSETLERFMRRMFTHLIAALAQSLRDQDLSLGEIAALHLVDRDGQMAVGDLAAALGLAMPAASRLASGLVERRLLTRSEDASDRRVRVLALSRDGRALIDRTSRERVGAAIVAAAAIPGAAPDVIATALRDLVKREAPQKIKGEKR